jgi:hypothetical protein
MIVSVIAGRYFESQASALSPRDLKNVKTFIYEGKAENMPNDISVLKIICILHVAKCI